MKLWNALVNYLIPPKTPVGRHMTIVERRESERQERLELVPLEEVHLYQKFETIFDRVVAQHGNPIADSKHFHEDVPELVVDPRDPLAGPAFRHAAMGGRAAVL